MYIRNLLVFIFISSSVYSQNDFKIEEAIRFKNKISEKLTYVFNTNSNDSILTNKDIYNALGKHIQDLRYDEKGEVRYSYTVEYNSNGMMNKQTGYSYGEISTILTYKYDNNNNRTENFQHKPDGTLLNHQKRIYDNNNLNTELFNKSKESNTFYLSSKYFYGNNDLYSSTERYLENGEKASTTFYEYNKNTVSIYENKKKKKNLSTIKKYNKTNQLIEKRFLSSNKRIEYKYDENQNLIEEIVFIKNKLDSRKKYYYYKFSI